MNKNEFTLKVDKQEFARLTNETVDHIIGKLDAFTEKLGATKRKEYQIVAMVFTAVFSHLLADYHMNLDPDDVTQFLSLIRNEFIELYEDQNDDDDCDEDTADGCKMHVHRVDCNSDEGKALMREIIEHLKGANERRKKD